MIKEIKINGIERLHEAAAQFLNVARPGTVYAFRGAMGAGKTTFIGEICRLLDSEDEANSPTFSIVNEYDTAKWGKVYHIDCYRLEGEEDACDIGMEDYLGSGCACFIEWPEIIEGLLPPETVEVEITAEPDGSRLVRIQSPQA